jgi:hypothetical protein
MNESNWKTRTYATGASVGLVLGMLAAYLFARAAEEEADRNGGKPEKIGTMQLISIGLATLTLIRQIAELGKSGKKK